MCRHLTGTDVTGHQLAAATGHWRMRATVADIMRPPRDPAGLAPGRRSNDRSAGNCHRGPRWPRALDRNVVRIGYEETRRLLLRRRRTRGYPPLRPVPDVDQRAGITLTRVPVSEDDQVGLQTQGKPSSQVTRYSFWHHTRSVWPPKRPAPAIGDRTEHVSVPFLPFLGGHRSLEKLMPGGRADRGGCC